MVFDTVQSIYSINIRVGECIEIGRRIHESVNAAPKRIQCVACVAVVVCFWGLAGARLWAKQYIVMTSASANWLSAMAAPQRTELEWNSITVISEPPKGRGDPKVKCNHCLHEFSLSLLVAAQGSGRT